jgi:pimeloyl-ACP methyl ester carboxylesterase
VDVPETRYARSGEVSIAYQVFGEGPDLVYVPGFVSNIENMWTQPGLARFFSRLAGFARVILFDKRGTGLSDRVPPHELPTLEERIDDVRAVMDAAGSERATLYGHSEGGPMCILFAATHPQRTTALILYATYAKRQDPDEDYPWAPKATDREAYIERLRREWASDDLVREFLGSHAPSVRDDPAFRRWTASWFRSGASPSAAAALTDMNRRIDVRHVLPSVQAPTLVLCRVGDHATRIEENRYVAARIPGARMVELPGEDHLFWVGGQDELADEVEEFLTGVRPVAEVDRFLATALFTDVVSGTQKAAELGDRGWRSLIERHHGLVRRELERYRGREIDTAGDGFFATFDGPGRAIRCASAVRDGVRDLGIEIRAGLHTGECEEIAGKVGGIAVITAARVREKAEPSEVLVSSTVKDLVAGSGIDFEERGVHTLKGVPGEWRLYRVAQL